MIVTILKDMRGEYWLSSTDAAFVEAYGAGFRSGEAVMLENMLNVANWAESKGLEVLFEVERG